MNISQPLYEKIGTSYSITRKADQRIAERLIELLGLPTGSTILDVGAGTGNYSFALANAGFSMLAVEPSKTMLSQASPNKNIKWINSFAEAIPLDDESAQGAIIICAYHHFQNNQQALKEIIRVVGAGPILIFTWDVQKLPQLWLTDYFPEIYPDHKAYIGDAKAAVQNISHWTNRKCEIFSFPLPCDLTDHFITADWARPEAYLDPEIRQGISSFAEASENIYEKGLKRLKDDLQSGHWDKQYGELRQKKEYDIGYCFLKISSP
ncbi:MAG: class I SAM-dependent methyltransferase [Chthoniobacterales bacterium]